MQTDTEKAGLKGVILKHKQWLWYALYCFALFIIFLYLLFPSEILKKYFINEADRIYPDFKIKLDTIKFSFPLGVKIKNLEVSNENVPDTNIYESDNTTISPGILSHLVGHGKYSFQSSTMGGSISGFIQKVDETAKDGVNTRIKFKDIHLDDRAFLHPLISRRLAGLARGEINFNGNLSFPENGDFDISLDIFDGKIKLLNPILSLSAIDFYKISLAAKIENKKISITGTELSGDGIKGSASGTIRLNSDFLTSRLDLKGELEFSSAYFQDMPDVQNAIAILTSGKEDGKLTFNVRGTIDKPRLNFDRR